LTLALAWPAVAAPVLPDDEDVFSPQALEWLNDDGDATPPQAGADELMFLPEPPAGRTLHSQNQLTIDADSLADGWVHVVQCYDGLDAVPATEIVYRYRELRDLHIDSQRNIGQATVRGQSVQLSDVRDDATLCVGLQARIFYTQPDGGFLLRSGPFHRRFLDGYFPLHVTLEVRFPAASLKYAGTRPESQPGFSVTRRPGSVAIDSWFAGMLNIEIAFKTAVAQDPE
jgi:hypothetical protein